MTSDSFVAKKAGIAWRQASQEEQDYWKNVAEQNKLKHKQDHPDYVYQPRKSCEVRRRKKRHPKTASKPASADSSPLPKTRNGNVVLEMGNKKHSVKDLEAKLMNYNEGVQLRSGFEKAAINMNAPASIYSERAQEHQDHHNFYDEILGNTMVKPLLLSNLDVDTAFNSNQNSFFDAELARMDNL